MTRTTPFSTSPPASSDMHDFMLPDTEGDFLSMVASPITTDIFNGGGLMMMVIHLKVSFHLTPLLKEVSV